MGTFSTAEPTNVAGWSEEVSGEIVSMYNQGKYGYAYYSKCAVTRLSDNSVCVRIKMYSNAIMGWGAANKAAYHPLGQQRHGKRVRPERSVQLRQRLLSCRYLLLHASVNVYRRDGDCGMTSGHRPTTANSPVTLAVPESVGDVLYFKTGGTWKQAMLYRKGGTWKNAPAKFKAGGIWK